MKIPKFELSGALMKGVVVAAALAGLYYDTFAKLVEDWINLPDFSHGFLIPLVSGYLLYERRDRLSGLKPDGKWSGLIIVIMGLLILSLGKLAMEYFLMRVSLLIVLTGTVYFLLGRGYLKVTLFPIAFLVFMIPLPSILLDKITFPMQLIASRFSAAALTLMGVPVLREGNIIELSNISLEVAVACSGLRSLISLLALSVIFSYLSQKKLWKRGVLVASTIPIAIAANVFRVAGTGLLADHYGSSVAQGYFHEFSGWVLYMVAFGCFLSTGRLLNRMGARSV